MSLLQVFSSCLHFLGLPYCPLHLLMSGTESPHHPAANDRKAMWSDWAMAGDEIGSYGQPQTNCTASPQTGHIGQSEATAVLGTLPLIFSASYY
jgi:hypothetical protein